jgi:hypothetical protein
MVMAMVERVVAVFAALAAPLIPVLLRSSRRHRDRSRIRAYAELAKQLEATDVVAASKLRDLISDLVDALVETERNALNRRFDPATLIVAPAFFAPALIPLGLVWPIGGFWEFVLLGVVCLWGLIVIYATVETAFKPRDKNQTEKPRDKGKSNN